MLDISLRFADPRWRGVYEGHNDLLTAALQATFAELDLPDKAFVVAVSLVDDAEIRLLNKQYRHKDAATNVLSFPMLEDVTAIADGPEPVELGDILLAFETIEREATDQHKPLAHHVAHLLVHGLLHLLGFDHGEDAAAAEMEELETDILRGLDIDDPYRGIE